jgi:hypothetical protein
MLDLDSSDLILRATVCHDLIELEEIVDFADDLNLERERLSVIVNRLSYLLIDEG